MTEICLYYYYHQIIVKVERVRGMVELTTLHLYRFSHYKVPKIQYLSKHYAQSYECGRMSQKHCPSPYCLNPLKARWDSGGPIWVHMPYTA